MSVVVLADWAVWSFLDKNLAVPGGSAHYGLGLSKLPFTLPFASWCCGEPHGSINESSLRIPRRMQQPASCLWGESLHGTNSETATIRNGRTRSHDVAPVGCSAC